MVLRQVAWTSRVREVESEVSCEDVWRVWVAPASVIRELLVPGATGGGIVARSAPGGARASERECGIRMFVRLIPYKEQQTEKP